MKGMFGSDAANWVLALATVATLNSNYTHTLTDPVEVMEASSIPHNLPQAAPISRDGMKTPADTARP